VSIPNNLGGYGPDDRGSRARFPARAGKFSLHHRVQNGSGAHPASHPMGTGVKRPGVKLTAPLHLVQRPRIRGAIPPIPQYAFKAWCSAENNTGTTLHFFTFLGPAQSRT
jgi:hypothetical protein